jgi:hypothetical protein
MSHMPRPLRNPVHREPLDWANRTARFICAAAAVYFAIEVVCWIAG